MPPKIVKTALYVEVTERLRSMIASGHLKPGAWIDEQKLAEQLGVSRTPFREAIRILASEGLLRIEPRRGCYVNELTEKDLDDIFPLMAMLEGRCAYEAAQRVTEKQIKNLDDLHVKLVAYAKAKKIDEYYTTNREIHVAIQNMAANQWLSNMVKDLRKILNLSRHRSLHLPGRITESCNEHLAIFSALKSRDPVSAESAMKTHILRQREALKELIVQSRKSA
ncbi:GntR family transcriptional regulator [Polynucleobacter sp. MWH-Loch1C5]|uniref:GntR family transcriptional regulator n=1 Tax=Polynucleobacter sp. MWH-Loch1C5 TaxID=2689108 RepID=UPI001C0B98D1|nr:GntR family transcriptional regulator [Polynucleobacter sp. MWH-Loch1C5]MBU3542112.1 GntR family transcriptional regulator [Polynucleobacter sp. MWH-Loch1C5]